MAEKSKYQDIDAVDAALDKGVAASTAIGDSSSGLIKQVSDLELNTSNVLSEEIHSEDDEIVIKDDSDNVVATINTNGADFKNLKSNGASVLISNDISGKADKTYVDAELAKKQNTIEQISSVTAENVDEEQVWQSDSDTNPEVFVKIGSYGIKAKAIRDINGKLYKNNIIVVDKNGNGDYTELYDALANVNDTADNPVTILLMQGKYNMPTRTNGVTQYNYRHNNRYLSIIGVDKNACVVYNNVGNYNQTDNIDSAPLAFSGSCYIYNISLVSTTDNFIAEKTADNENAYCFHLDFEHGDGDIMEFNNCKFVNDHWSALGCGSGYNSLEIKIVNCEFDVTTRLDTHYPIVSESRGAIYVHLSNPYPYNCKVTLIGNTIVATNGMAVKLDDVVSPTGGKFLLTAVRNSIYEDNMSVLKLTEKTKLCMQNSVNLFNLSNN